jgi:uncharacterized protein
MVRLGDHLWYELMSEDMAAATVFYSECMGWRTQAMDGSPMPYTMWLVNGQPMAGVMDIPPDARAMGAPACWVAYVGTPDVDATAKKAETLGGKVVKPPWNIPEIGRVAVLRDPQGATFCLFTPERDVPEMGETTDIGAFSWQELNTTDYPAAWGFYSTLFEWEHTESLEVGPLGTYFMFRSKGGGTTMGGMCNAATAMGTPPHWLYYVTVDEVDKAAQRIVKNGGKILGGPETVPGGGQIAQCQDPQGVAFAIFAHPKR